MSVCHITGINSSAQELEIAGESLDIAIEADLNNFDIESLADEYDLIICSHVLEHLIFPKELLFKLGQKLKPQGRIIVLVPNFGHWKGRWMAVRGEFNYQDHGLMDRTHLRFFTWRSLEQELKPENLVIHEMLNGGHFPLPGLRRVLPQSWASRMDSFAMESLPNLLSWEIGFILRLD